MKVAQYEVLGNDAYREVRPGGTIETFGLLISRTRVPSASTRRSSLPGRVVSKTKPSLRGWATINVSLRDGAPSALNQNS